MRSRHLGAIAVACGVALLAPACAEDPPPLVLDSVVEEASGVTTVPTIDVSGASIPSVDLDTTVGSDAATTTAAGPITAPPPTSSTIPVIGADEVVGEAWANATANLAGLSSECGNLSYVSAPVDADRDLVITGVAQQGLWASRDGAQEWTQLGQGEESATITNRTAAIVYDPENPDTFWESGTYNEGGVYRTDDGGETFVQLGDIVHVDNLGVDFTDPQRQTLLASVHEQPQVMRSSDGGATWQDVSAGLPEGAGVAAATYVFDDRVHLVGTRLGTESGVFRTTDAGETWARVSVNPIIGAPLRVADGTLYWLIDGGEGLMSSTDDGETWEIVGVAPFHPFGASIIDIGDGRLAALGTARILISAPGGANWVEIGPPYPFEPNGLAYSPARNAFYVWKFDCNATGSNDVPEEAIVTVEFVTSAPS